MRLSRFEDAGFAREFFIVPFVLPFVAALRSIASSWLRRCGSPLNANFSHIEVGIGLRCQKSSFQTLFGRRSDMHPRLNTEGFKIQMEFGFPEEKMFSSGLKTQATR